MTQMRDNVTKGHTSNDNNCNLCFIIFLIVQSFLFYFILNVKQYILSLILTTEGHDYSFFL